MILLGYGRKIFYFCWFIFVLLVMIDPSGQLFHLKELGFALIIFLSILVGRFKIPQEPFIVFFQIFICALLSVIFALLFFGADLSESLSYFKALLFIFIFSVISKNDYKDIIKVNARVGLVLSIVISCLFGAMILGYLTFEQLSQTNTIAIASRDFMGIPTLMFFYMTMPFVFFAFIYYLRKNHLFASAIIGFSIVIGGSRTPILCAIVILFYVLYDKNRKSLKYILLLLGVFTIICLLQNLTSKANLGEGDSIKFKLVHDLFYNSSVIPHGAGLPYWDASRKEMTSSTEMTYFEMLYQYGWVMFPFVMSLILAPIIRLRKYLHAPMIKDFIVAYALYLINAGTNPLLFSSTGMYVYACALVIMSQRRSFVTNNR